MDWLWLVFSLIGVLGLFFILVYALKKLNTGVGYVNGNRIKVIDRVSLGRDGMLVVVSVAGKLMLIGVTGQHIEKLAELEMSPEEYNERSADDRSGMKFSEALAEVLNRKKTTKKDESDDEGEDQGNN